VALATPRRRHLAWAAGALVLFQLLSSGMVYTHTGRASLVSGNGALNFVFGRCHNHVLKWRTPRTAGQFIPVGLAQMYRSNRKAQQHGTTPTIEFVPATTRVLTMTGPPTRFSWVMPRWSRRVSDRPASSGSSSSQ
jgi:hypothetical protein